MAMADLASNQGLRPVSLNDISLRQNISLSYLEQLFSKLKNENLVKSIRGPSGGYVLEKNPKESPDAFEHASKIQWYVGLAANYTTIFEAFCDKD